MPHKSYRKESRSDWGRTLSEDENIEPNGVQLGAILRIADSLEKMEQPYLRLLDDIKYLSKRNVELLRQNERMAKSINAYRGVITKMKKKKADGTAK